MKEQDEQYFVRFPEDVKEMLEEVRTAGWETGRVSMETAGRLMERAIELDSDILIGVAYYYYADAQQEEADKDGTKLRLLGCINYLQGKGPCEYIAAAYYRLGQLEDSQDNPVMAVEYFESGLSVCEDNGLWELKGMLLSGAGACYFRLEQMQEAFRYYNEAVRQFRKLRRELADRKQPVLALIGRAGCYYSLGRVREARMDRDRIIKALKALEREERPYAETYLFFAMCCHIEGDSKTALLYADMAGEQVEADCLAGRRDCVNAYINILLQMQEYDRLSVAMKRLKPSLDRCQDRELQLLLLSAGISCTADRMSEAELRESVTEFFTLYNGSIRKRGEAVAGNLEVRRQLRQIQEKQQELRLLNRQLLSSSLHDALTGLPNRGYLNEHSEKIFDRALDKGCSCGICLLDVDYFKQLNDRYGHMEGDRCLTEIGRILSAKRSSRVFGARYGGDEFALVLYHMEKEEIQKLLTQIGKELQALAIPNVDSEAGAFVSCSIGCFYGIPKDGDKLWDYFGGADRALYAAKNGGKNRFVIREKELAETEEMQETQAEKPARPCL